MPTVSIELRDLPARFTEMMTLAAGGTEITVTVEGVPRARVVPLPQQPRVAGLHPGAIETTAAFNAPLSAGLGKATP
jgi:prevent-host-death family protein